MPTVTHHLPGLRLTDHFFNIPLDHAAPEGERLEIYAREVVAPSKAEQALPWLVFLQGGPGFPAPRPPALASWLPRALQQFRVLLIGRICYPLRLLHQNNLT